jgi:hypothetical protein
MIANNGLRLMFDKSFNVPKTINRTDLPSNAVLLGSKLVNHGPIGSSDVEFDELPQAADIIKCFADNMMLDKLTEFTYLVVEYDMDLDAYEVQWYMTFPNNEMKVHLALIETDNEILGGLY